MFEWFWKRAAEVAPGEAVEVDLDPGISEPRWFAGVLFQIAARSPEDVREGRYRLVLNAVFNGVGLALARFAHLLDASAGGAVTAELRRAWAPIARPGAWIAELTFNHEARTANAGLRPVLFGREIELAGDRVSDGVERIQLRDLTLRYDTTSDRLVLRSLSSGMEVIPVVSSGVSPSGIVSALIHVGRQGMHPVGHLPGFHAPGIVRWPRYTVGRVVLFRARWVFPREELPPHARSGAPLSDAAFFLEVARWRASRELPRHVFVHTSSEPKPFYVDLEAPVLVGALRAALAHAGDEPSARVIVTEMLPGPDELWVRDRNGAYCAEFLLQMEDPASESGPERARDEGIHAVAVRDE
jgi:Lantibiotic dehydratase, N terminus